MKYQYLLALFLALMVFPIVKADGCGIVCPKGIHDTMTFSLSVICNFFTWAFCHIFSLFAMLFLSIVVYVFWHYQPEKKRKKISMFFYVTVGILFIAMLYPYISAWVVMTPYTTTETTTTIPVDTCEFFANSTCQMLLPEGNITHVPYVSTNHFRISSTNTGCMAEVQTSQYINLTSITTGVSFTPPDLWYFIIGSSFTYEDIIVTNYTIGEPYWIYYMSCSG